MKILISILVLFSTSLFAESYTLEEVEAMHNDILLTCDDDAWNNTSDFIINLIIREKSDETVWIQQKRFGTYTKDEFYYYLNFPSTDRDEATLIEINRYNGRHATIYGREPIKYTDPDNTWVSGNCKASAAIQLF